mmetsp:Transcript_31991/g.69925  ORF Transcript_31991/g.69925 Transcript_31991/m.69925 type:complete len:768 (+) Transcript_31991:93-2396(+)
MGCGSSSAAAAGAKAGAKGKGDPQYGQLLEHYNLGKVLGQGAFGIVYLCKKKGTSEEYAVKMIDKAETKLSEIQKEAEMLTKCRHPSIVKLHDVYYEKVFVCMVMDIYKGGDLIEGMQAHWKTKGMIPPVKIRPLVAQMLEGIAFLHSKEIVHRDVKGDNYLMDRLDIAHPQLRIYLSDFGTVVECKAGTRLSQGVGTKVYWAPEFYASNYALPVDIWAIGIVSFGMVDGRFPFKGEADVRNKNIRLPPRCPEDCVALIQKLLTKEEKDRPTAAVLLTDKWILSGDATHPAPEQPGGPAEEFKPEIKEDGANAGIDERRRELVERLENAAKKEVQGRLPLSSFLTPKFEIADKRTSRVVSYEWRAQSVVEQGDKAILNLTGAKKEDTAKGSGGTDLVRGMLEKSGISCSSFGTGQAKTLEEFSGEIHSGAARLMMDAAKHSSVVRVVDIVLLRLFHSSSGGRYLIQSGEKYSDGRQRTGIYQLPGTKKEPHENTMQVAQRILDSRLVMNDCKVRLDNTTKEFYEEEEESPSYPGVRTVYRKEIVEGKITTTDPSVLARVGLKVDKPWSSEDSRKVTRVFCWMSRKQCQSHKVKLFAPKEGTEVSALVYAPVGLNMEELMSTLEKGGVDVSKFGKGSSKTLKEFSDELAKAEATLATEGGQLKRIVDVVVLRVVNSSNGQLLVEAEEVLNSNTKVLNRMPATKRRPDEHQFLAAQRVLTKVLHMDPNFVTLDPSSVLVLEEEKDSSSYPGIRTIYKKRIITAKLLPAS